MDKSDVVLLLAFASTYDYRKTGDADIEAWHLAVGDLDFDDAKQAVVTHYRASTDRMMPAHLRQGVKAIRDARRSQEPSEAQQLPSPFETDEERAGRGRRGGAHAHEVIADLARRMQNRADYVPGAALARLREITDSPWPAEIEESDR